MTASAAWPSWWLLGSPIPPSFWASFLSHCWFCKAPPLLSPTQIFQEYLKLRSTPLSIPEISISQNSVSLKSCGDDCSFIICHPQVKGWSAHHPFSPQKHFLISPPMTVVGHPERTLRLPPVTSRACLEM